MNRHTVAEVPVIKKVTKALLAVVVSSLIISLTIIIAGASIKPAVVIDLQRCTGTVSPPNGKVELAGHELGLTHEQTKILRLAHSVGKETGHPEDTQAIALAETHAGLLDKVGDGGASLGEMQTQLPACRAVLAAHPELGTYTDAQLKKRLLTDSDFAVRMGAYYFEILHQNYASVKNKEKRRKSALLCYNAGPRNVRINRDPQKYLKRVDYFLKTVVRPFNKQAQLT
jgi:hypothetical protein